MKVILKNLLFIILFSFLMINVHAASLSIDGKSSINEGSTETIDIRLKLQDGEIITRVDFDVNYNSDIFNVKLISDNNTYGYAPVLNNNTVSVLKVNNDLAEGIIVTLSITANSIEENTDEIISIQNIKINEADIEGSVSKRISIKKQATTTTRAKNTSAKIKGFTVNNATIKPAFSDKTKEYKIYVSKDTIKQITIKPEFEQEGTTMAVECTLGCVPDSNTPNKLNLIIGKNEATFTFTSEDGKNTETYKYIIYRGETTDGSNFLASLEIEGYTLNEEFDKNKLDYQVNIPYSVENVNVKIVPEDEQADIKIKGNENLVVGENVITITVTSAETNEKKIYNVTVTREEFVPEEDNTTNVTPQIESVAPKKDNNTLIIIIIAGVSVLIIGLSAYFIFFRKKDANEETMEMPAIKKKHSIIDDDKEPTSVDDALKDLMETKEMEIHDKPSN